MNLQRYVDKPRFKLLAKCLGLVACALAIAYITAQPPHYKPVLVKTEQFLPESTIINLDIDVISQDLNEKNNVTKNLLPTEEPYENQSAAEIILDPVEYISPWTFACVNGICQRRLYAENDLEKKEKRGKVSLEVCWLNCGTHGSIWPIPTQSESLAAKSLIPFQLSNLHFSQADSDSKELQDALAESFELTLKILRLKIDNSIGINENEKTGSVANTSVQISVKLTSPAQKLVFLLGSSEENYKLQISSHVRMEENGGIVKVDIEAHTYFGVRHALETFSQLVAFDENSKQFQIVGNVEIEDKPSFKYRGVLIDVARNFIPLTTLQRIVDGMSYNKMNILHLHFADIESFPVLHQKFPEMSICGSYSKKKTYKFEELGEFVKYARIRGIKIVPEFDPNHLRFLGDPSSLDETNCALTETKENNGFLVNLFSPSIMTAIGEFYKSLFDVFDNDVIHFGSFDLSFDLKCLMTQNDNIMVNEWMEKENITDFALLRSSFLNKVIEKIKEVNDGKSVQAIIFGSDFSNSNLEAFNDSSYIMQTWENVDESSRWGFLVEGNYRIVVSDAKYSKLNSGFNGPNHKYNLWQSLYDSSFSPGNGSSTQILGSEVLIWTQNTNEGSIEAKLWPRASALAERLWSNPKSREKDVYSRLNHHNNRMLSRGLKTESLQPESCYLISGNCDDPRHRI